MKTTALAAAVVFVCAALSGSVIAASKAEDLPGYFARANVEYQKGDFAAAERSYLEILGRGVSSGPVYYNLGNACFKQKKLGEAIYYWEMARRLMPRDQDVRENLELANLMVLDRIEVPVPPLPVRWISRLGNLLSASQEAWLVLALFAATNILLGASMLVRNPQRAFRCTVAAAISLGLVLVFGASLGWKLYQQHSRREGVIVEQKTDVRSGPGGENVTVFTVHEGLMVQVRGTSDGWSQVSLPNGWNGWVPSRSLRVL